MALCRAVVAVIYLLNAITDVSKNQTAELYMKFVKKKRPGSRSMRLIFRSNMTNLTKTDLSVAIPIEMSKL